MSSLIYSNSDINKNQIIWENIYKNKFFHY